MTQPDKTDELMAARSTFKEGSLASRMMDYFDANPSEELERSDVARKFDVAASSVDACTASAIAAGMLNVRTNDEGVRVWCAGPKLLASSKRTRTRTGTAHAPFGALNAGKPRTATVAAMPLPAPETLKVEKGIPMPSHIRPGAGGKLFEAVFESMQAGDSFAIPRHASKRLIQAAHAFGKRTERNFSVRHMDQFTARIWRVK